MDAKITRQDKLRSLQIDSNLGVGTTSEMTRQRLAVFCGLTDSHQPVFQSVVEEDVAEARANERPYAVIHKRVYGTLAG